MIQETSLLAYVEVLENISERQSHVYKILDEFGTLNNTMIAKKLNLPINCITGRTNELRRKGLIINIYKGTCPITKKRTLFWKVKHKLK